MYLFSFIAMPLRREVLRLAQMKYRYFVPQSCKQNAIFSVQAIKTGHTSIIYRQIGDILSVSSKGTAATKWRMKISRQLYKYCRYWLQNFTVTLFQLCAKDDFNASLQLCNHSCKNQPIHFAKLWQTLWNCLIIKKNQNFSQFIGLLLLI